MIHGRVVGKVWSTRRLESLPSGALLEIETGGGSRLIAYDPLGCDLGEDVLVTQGSVAAAWFGAAPAPIDALIIGSIDASGSA